MQLSLTLHFRPEGSPEIRPSQVVQTRLTFNSFTIGWKESCAVDDKLCYYWKEIGEAVKLSLELSHGVIVLCSAAIFFCKLSKALLSLQKQMFMVWLKVACKKYDQSGDKTNGTSPPKDKRTTDLDTNWEMWHTVPRTASIKLIITSPHIGASWQPYLSVEEAILVDASQYHALRQKDIPDFLRHLNGLLHVWLQDCRFLSLMLCSIGLLPITNTCSPGQTDFTSWHSLLARLRQSWGFQVSSN